jgi:hypothetical protein
MSLITALFMMLALSVFAMVMLIVLVAICRPHKRRIYPHQVQHRVIPVPDDEPVYLDVLDNHEIDPLCDQLDASGHDKFGRTWEDLHGQRCADGREQHRRDMLKGSMNSISSDTWRTRINRPDGYVGAEYSEYEDK